ncbi:unnamed protein product [Pleuronectes platessa]|uniref:Uncharacterized protein n=1 Tax=Pleuronectes platessa TaxID=8262 RepID=A0A9N7V1H8_PLEPL|nr:unnamed protein product [Pleuronectes platessa]
MSNASASCDPGVAPQQAQAGICSRDIPDPLKESRYMALDERANTSRASPAWLARKQSLAVVAIPAPLAPYGLPPASVSSRANRAGGARLASARCCHPSDI